MKPSPFYLSVLFKAAVSEPNASKLLSQIHKTHPATDLIPATLDTQAHSSARLCQLEFLLVLTMQAESFDVEAVVAFVCQEMTREFVLVAIALLLVCRDRNLALTMQALKGLNKDMDLLLTVSREEAPDLYV